MIVPRSWLFRIATESTHVESGSKTAAATAIFANIVQADPSSGVPTRTLRSSSKVGVTAGVRVHRIQSGEEAIGKTKPPRNYIAVVRNPIPASVSLKRITDAGRREQARRSRGNRRSDPQAQRQRLRSGSASRTRGPRRRWSGRRSRARGATGRRPARCAPSWAERREDEPLDAPRDNLLANAPGKRVQRREHELMITSPTTTKAKYARMVGTSHSHEPRDVVEECDADERPNYREAHPGGLPNRRRRASRRRAPRQRLPRSCSLRPDLAVGQDEAEVGLDGDIVRRRSAPARCVPASPPPPAETPSQGARCRRHLRLVAGSSRSTSGGSWRKGQSKSELLPLPRREPGRHSARGQRLELERTQAPLDHLPPARFAGETNAIRAQNESGCARTECAYNPLCPPCRSGRVAVTSRRADL